MADADPQIRPTADPAATQTMVISPPLDTAAPLPSDPAFCDDGACCVPN